MDLYELSADGKPSILFRVECLANRSFNHRGDLCSRRTDHGGAPRQHDFDNHLSWERKPTGLLSFSSSWGRTMRRRKMLEDSKKEGIVVIAVWTKDLTGVYSAEKVALMLEYPDTESSCRKRLPNHLDEYLVEGGIAADEYRILAVFEGGGTERVVTFECPFYKNSTIIPSEFFPGKRSNDALKDIEDEIYRRTGVRDDMKRDELVKGIMGRPHVFPTFLYPTIQYLVQPPPCTE